MFSGRLLFERPLPPEQRSEDVSISRVSSTCRLKLRPNCQGACVITRHLERLLPQGGLSRSSLMNIGMCYDKEIDGIYIRYVFL